MIKFQNFNFTIQNEFVRTFLQLLELVCIALLFPYSLLIMLTPFVWLYEIFGWFAVILFPLIYGFILVRLTEFYMKFKAILLAAGIGSRLRPFTENCPKPMLKVGDKPILEILLEQFIENGFTNFYSNLYHFSD